MPIDFLYWTASTKAWIREKLLNIRAALWLWLQLAVVGALAVATSLAVMALGAGVALSLPEWALRPIGNVLAGLFLMWFIYGLNDVGTELRKK